MTAEDNFVVRQATLLMDITQRADTVDNKAISSNGCLESLASGPFCYRVREREKELDYMHSHVMLS